MTTPPAALTAAQLQRSLDDAFPNNRQVVAAVTSTGCIVTRPVDTRDCRPGGTVSGPTLMMLADTGAWMTVMSRIGAVLLAVTTSLQIDFLRKPALGAALVATCELVKLGKVLAVVRVVMCSDNQPDRPVATATVTYSIPPAPGAAKL